MSRQPLTSSACSANLGRRGALVWPIRAIVVLLGVVLAHVTCADELVRFESARYRIGELQQRLARERGETIKAAPATIIEGYLSKPEGDGPFPAVVSMHGCNGLRAASRAAGGEYLKSLGYVAFVVDSFATRGIKEACVSPMPDRHADAIGALTYLSSLPYVDRGRIALLGR